MTIEKFIINEDFPKCEDERSVWVVRSNVYIRAARGISRDFHRLSILNRFVIH